MMPSSEQFRQIEESPSPRSSSFYRPAGNAPAHPFDNRTGQAPKRQDDDADRSWVLRATPCHTVSATSVELRIGKFFSCGTSDCEILDLLSADRHGKRDSRTS
jgi:hypothetical protein